MNSNSFAELTRQVHLLNDLILSDMVYSDEEYTEVAENFSRHLYATKYWFLRTSHANKKRFVLALLTDLRSGWALSLLLKSIWNCRTKDAVLSSWNHPKTLSIYDQIPIDHNRTAQPLKTLAQVMTDERRWFHTLEPEAQAMMLLELLYTAGGPVMMEVLRRAQLIYEYNRDLQLQNLLECIVVDDQATPKKQTPSTEKVKKDQPTVLKHKSTGPLEDSTSPTVKTPPPGNAQKNLEANLAAWNSVIKTIRDNQKLEEVEMTFKDGSKKKIWKVNRPKPEATETSDLLQLLPSAVAKRILSFLPKAALPEYAKVNKYWAYLVEDMNAEAVARNKLNSDMEKLQEAQAMMLLELLYTAGGPVMMEVLRRAQLIYEYNRDLQLQNLLECIVVDDQATPKKQTPSTEKVKKDQPTVLKHKSTGPLEDSTSPTVKTPPPGNAQKNLEANLAAWNSVIKTIRDNQKLEEVEMTFKDGSKKKIWKVNRPKPEATETSDLLQLLPSAVAKRILSFLPKAALPEYAKVNKYWAYLVEDMNAEAVARNKLNSDMEKLQDMMLKHDTSMDVIAEAPGATAGQTSVATGSLAVSFTKGGMRRPVPNASTKASEKSTACSFRHYFDEKMRTDVRIKPKAIQNLADLQERLDRRGAADDNLWQWCRYIIKMSRAKKDPGATAGLLRFEDYRFPTPLLKYNLSVPLQHIVEKDPAVAFAVFPKSKKNVSEASMVNLQKEPGTKRFSLWSRDFSSLYKVLKVASYQSPV